MEATPLTATDTATIRRFIELDMADGEWWARMADRAYWSQCYG